MRTLPVPADFASLPDDATRRSWAEADREHRPERLSRIRTRMADARIDAYLGVRPEHMRWVTGFSLRNGEEKVAGHSGQFLVGADELVVVTDSRYTIQARREAPDAVVDEIGYSLPAVWSRLLERVGARRVALEGAVVPHALWVQLEAAAPGVEHVPADGWIEAMRATKTADEVERIAAACAVSDRALAALLPDIRPGLTERDLALRLEWLIRTSGAETLAFDVACLSGPEAALPHGAPGPRPVLDASVLLFDFGAQVEGYRSDMTRTLFVGEPRPEHLQLYDVVRAAQQAVIDELERAVGDAGAPAVPDGHSLDELARRVIDADGRWPAYGHGLGHGIGLATHELPRLGRTATHDPLPTPTVFSVEPGIYLEGQLGVRIEDLVHLDARRGLVERLTHFPRDVIALPS